MFNQKPEFFINHLGKGGITHLVGVAGAVFMCCVAVLLSRSTHPVINLCKSGLKYFGKNSYVLLAFHQIIIMLFLSLLPGMPKILMHTFMWLTVVILIELITRRFPFILGREKKKEKSEVPCSWYSSRVWRSTLRIKRLLWIRSNWPTSQNAQMAFHSLYLWAWATRTYLNLYCL